MFKALRLILVSALVLAAGAAFAQTSDSHGVVVNIPSVLRIRIVTSGTTEAASPTVTFDYVTQASDVAAYEAAVAAGGDDLLPTSVSEFADIIVFSNQANPWNVSVVATDFASTGFDLADITVTPGTASGLSPEVTATVSSSWSLTTTDQQVVTSGDKTGGWKSLGFNGNDYTIHVDGTEDPGSYSTTVTYTIAAP